MKKIYSIVIIFGIFILISSSAFATESVEKENKKRENAFKTALSSYMQTFMTDETPKEDRITTYEYSGFGITGETEDSLSVSISFHITPINENNTTWHKYSNICFATFSKVNNEYVLNKISRYPDNYDKFLARFEEYKNNKGTSETIVIQGEKQNNLENQEIQKINNNLIVVFVILFVISSIVLLSLVKKRIGKYKSIVCDINCNEAKNRK